jgi:hypothetical protein
VSQRNKLPLCTIIQTQQTDSPLSEPFLFTKFGLGLERTAFQPKVSKSRFVCFLQFMPSSGTVEVAGERALEGPLEEQVDQLLCVRCGSLPLDLSAGAEPLECEASCTSSGPYCSACHSALCESRAELNGILRALCEGM